MEKPFVEFKIKGLDNINIIDGNINYFTVHNDRDIETIEFVLKETKKYCS